MPPFVQATIMSVKCAERCGLMRLVDTRFAGVARGVGSGKIVGKVHSAPIKVGGHNLLCSFTILEQEGVEFLFGLDMLKSFQCCIDLQHNCLRFGSIDESIRFLSEHEIPKSELFSEDAAAQAQASAGGSAGKPSSAPSTGAPSQPSGQSTPSFPEEKISALTALGFQRQEAIQALQVCNGNEEQAASLLFSGM